MLNLLNTIFRITPAPGARPGRLNGAEVLSTALTGLVAFAAAWPTVQATLTQVGAALPDRYRELLSAAVATVSLLVASGTQIYRLWHHRDSGGPRPTGA